MNSLMYITHISVSHQSPRYRLQIHPMQKSTSSRRIVRNRARNLSIECSINQGPILRTCKNCKTQFDPVLNHPRACRYHTAHFGGETKRKFECVFKGGTMDTPGSGKVYQYWHCCGAEDPFDPGCTSARHASYDD